MCKKQGFLAFEIFKGWKLAWDFHQLKVILEVTVFGADGTFKLQKDFSPAMPNMH